MPPVTSPQIMHLQIRRCACRPIRILGRVQLFANQVIYTSAMALNRLLSTLGKNKTRPSTVLRTSVLTKSPDLGVTLLTSLHAPGTVTTALLAEVALVYGQMNEPPGARLRVGLTALLSTPCPTSLMVLNHFLALPSVEGKFLNRAHCLH